MSSGLLCRWFRPAVVRTPTRSLCERHAAATALYNGHLSAPAASVDASKKTNFPSWASHLAAGASFLCSETHPGQIHIRTLRVAERQRPFCVSGIFSLLTFRPLFHPSLRRPEEAAMLIHTPEK